MAEILLKTEKLTKSFGGLVAISKLSMEVKEGDTSLVISSFDTADNGALSAVAVIAIILILLLIFLWRKPIDLSENESGIDNYNSEF